VSASSPARARDDLVMRADPGLARRWYVAFLVPGLPLVVLFAIMAPIRLGWGALAVVLGGAAVVFPLAFLALELRVRLATTRLTAAAVSTRTWYGRLRRAPRDAIERIVLVPADLSAVSARPPVDYMLFVDGSGRCRLRSWTGGTAPAERIAFATALGVPVDVRELPVSAKRLREEFPGSISWHVAHQWLLALLVIAGGLLGTVAVLLVLAAAGRLG
jgi:hypothetical protein